MKGLTIMPESLVFEIHGVCRRKGLIYINCKTAIDTDLGTGLRQIETLTWGLG